MKKKNWFFEACFYLGAALAVYILWTTWRDNAAGVCPFVSNRPWIYLATGLLLLSIFGPTGLKFFSGKESGEKLVSAALHEDDQENLNGIESDEGSASFEDEED